MAARESYRLSLEGGVSCNLYSSGRCDFSWPSKSHPGKTSRAEYIEATTLSEQDLGFMRLALDQSKNGEGAKTWARYRDQPANLEAGARVVYLDIKGNLCLVPGKIVSVEKLERRVKSNVPKEDGPISLAGLTEGPTKP